MLRLAIHNLTRRRLRTGLTLTGIAAALAVLACLLAFGEGYERGLSRELNGMGLQMMLVPPGCPYDAAARVLKGRALDVSLPANSVDRARRDPAVAVAAPLLMVTVPRPSEGRTDLWVGIDESIRALKPWWALEGGSHWFQGENDVILGAEAAATEMRQVGDTLYSPETGRRFRVCGILARSGTSDDSEFFVPLATAQAMFRQPGRVTAVAIRLKDPTLLPEAAPRLQAIPGAQVTTMTEMMGVFLNLIGAVRTLVMAIAVVALTISALAVFNTMLSSVLERTGELGVMRAVGASRQHLFALLALESLLLTLVGCALGLVLALVLGRGVEAVVARFVPLATPDALMALSGAVIGQCLLVGVGMGLAAGLYPAWTASRLQPARALKAEAQ
jgi:putative ABC transport system permease protein